MFGDEWFVTGCVSSHFENMVIEGKVKAFARQVGDHTAEAWAEKENGDCVLTASLTVKEAKTALSERLVAAQEKDLGELFIIDRLELGMTTGPDNATSPWTSTTATCIRSHWKTHLQLPSRAGGIPITTQARGNSLSFRQRC